MIPFGAWEPDKPMVRSPHLRTASGCIPNSEGYEPFRSLTETTSALDSRCLGAVVSRDIDQGHHLYAADAAKLYELEGFTFTDRSRSGGYGPASDGTRWRFATYGDRQLATNGFDEVQYIDMSTGTAFDDLPGLSATAQFIAPFLEFVVLGAISTSSMTIKWSAFGDSEEWTPGTSQSDEQEFADGGRITGLASTDALYIFQEHCIRRMIYVGGATIMQIDKLTEGVGCIEPNSLIQIGGLFFFLADDGYYVFDGQSATPIGSDTFDQWFLAHSQRAYWARMSAAVNPKRKIVAWAFASDASGGQLDTMLIYNWAAQRATYVPYETEILLSAASLGVSLDDLTDNMDEMTVSFDDPVFLGGAYYFGGFSTDHRFGSFSGSPVEAIFDTGDMMIGSKGRASVEWVRPITDAITVTIAAAASMIPTDSPSFRPAVSKQPSGRCPMRGVNGNYIRVRQTIAAGQEWTFANAADFKAKSEGAR